MATIKLKLRRLPKTCQSSKIRKHLNIPKLRSAPIRNQFVLELKNHYSALTDLLENEADNIDINTQWNSFKTAYVESATRILGTKKKAQKDWITPQTWQKVSERKQLKAKMISAKSQRLHDQLQKDYSEKNKEVKRGARRDKRAYMDNLAKEAEKASKSGNLSMMYKITKLLSGNKYKTSVPLLDKSGKRISSEREEAARWVEHFQEVLNRPDPEEPTSPPPADDTLNINVDPPTVVEIVEAIKTLKAGKAAGIDDIHSEMLKADILTSATALKSLFRNIWNTESIPDDWARGLIVKIPKKGNLQKCDSWRGITLLSIPSKVFCRVILDRIKSAIDDRLREEQAGFREGRGCIDQIFALRNIIEQCMEWNVPLFVNFIDFQKAFDSIHRDTLWKILQHYGIPHKIVDLIRRFYDNFECNVIHRNTISEPFPVRSGVRQGCVLSPILFLTAIDWIMRKTTADKHQGIQWTLSSQLEDLDFADDLAILSTNAKHLQHKTDRLTRYALQAGLIVNITKTKVMSINTSTHTCINVNSEPLENVDNFIYLGSLISHDNGAQKDIQRRLGKARSTYARLQNIWKSNIYDLKTKIRLYNTLVKPVLLYGSECWRVTRNDMKTLSSFHHSCLRRICRVFWPNKISNRDLYRTTGSSDVISEIRSRRLRWLGHVFRMPPGRIPKVALRWTPPGKRKRGRPKITWRRTVEAELSEMGLSWGEAQRAAGDRDGWRCMTDALCPTGGEEN